MSGSIVVQPFGPTDGYATTKLPTGAEKGVLVIDLAGKHGNSIGLTARTMLKPGTSQESPVLITCTVEYGAPGKSSFMEVDVPVGRTNGVPAVAEDGSTVVVAPASILKVFARNDSYLIVPDLNGLVGNADTSKLTPPSEGGEADDALVTVFTNDGTEPQSSSKPTRTYYIGAITTVEVITFLNDPARAYAVPPLAKSWRLNRWSGYGPGSMAAATVTVYDSNGNGISNVFIKEDEPCPAFVLPGNAHRLGVSFVLEGAAGIASLTFDVGG